MERNTVTLCLLPHHVSLMGRHCLLITTKRNISDGINFKITVNMMELMIWWKMFPLNQAAGAFTSFALPHSHPLRWYLRISSCQWCLWRSLVEEQDCHPHEASQSWGLDFLWTGLCSHLYSISHLSWNVLPELVKLWKELVEFVVQVQIQAHCLQTEYGTVFLFPSVKRRQKDHFV